MNTFRTLICICMLALMGIFPHASSGSKFGKNFKVPTFKVRCSPDEMLVEIVKNPEVQNVYLEHLKSYPEKSCKPSYEGDKISFRLDLQDIYKCMITKVLNKGTGRKIYYHRVIVEYKVQPKTVFLVKCDSSVNVTSYDSEIEEIRISKRAAKPQFENFSPDEEVEITGEVTGRAPIPELIVGVRQNNLLIDDELTVKPGTPLEMNIALDRKSADIYGVMVSHMEVTDTRDQEEVLIFNGCTVDPYLFQNFLTEDGDSLRAEFKAFKFPESNFVLFKGTVNVCLDRCDGVECANGQQGYGKRRKRDVVPGSRDLNKVYEVSMATVVKVANEPVKGRPELWVEKATLTEVRSPDEAAIAALSEEYGAYKYIDFQENSSSHVCNTNIITLLITVSLCIINLVRN